MHLVLADIGAVSFSALATIAPALGFALWRPRTAPFAVVAGLAIAVLVWAWALLVPTLAPLWNGDGAWLTEGPFGIAPLAWADAAKPLSSAQPIKAYQHLMTRVDAKQIEALLGLWGDRHRASAEVKALALAHATALAEKIAEMEAMRRTLEDLAARCHGDDRPDCPILDDLAGQNGG